MMYGSWDMKRDKQCFVILGHFLPFLPFFDSVLPPFCRGWGWDSKQIFKKGGGLIKNKLKSQIFYDKKSL